MMTFNNKPVYDSDTFDYSTAKIGDYVHECVVDDAVNCLPPACMRMDCTQLGEPYSHREDETTGKWRPTYATFKRVGSIGAGADGLEREIGVWEYCGHCFRGENVQRGKTPPVVSLS